MLKYSALLLDSIEKEKAGIDYRCPEGDKKLLADLLFEINHYAEPLFWLALADKVLIVFVSFVLIFSILILLVIREIKRREKTKMTCFGQNR